MSIEFKGVTCGPHKASCCEQTAIEYLCVVVFIWQRYALAFHGVARCGLWGVSTQLFSGQQLTSAGLAWNAICQLNLFKQQLMSAYLTEIG